MILSRISQQFRQGTEPLQKCTQNAERMHTKRRRNAFWRPHVSQNRI